MITPSHKLRKVFGSRAKMSCAMASISAREGAFAEVHIAPVLEHSWNGWELVFFPRRERAPCTVDVASAIGDRRPILDRDTIKWNRITISSLCLSMIFSGNRFLIMLQVWGNLDAPSHGGNIGGFRRDSVSG